MNSKKILAQLSSLGFNAVGVTLQNIEHKNGSTWAYSNRKPSLKATVFGDDTVDASLSILRKGETVQASGDIYTMWLNSADDVEAKMYADDFGTDAVIILSDDGGELVSLQQAQELLIPKDVPASTDASSKSA